MQKDSHINMLLIPQPEEEKKLKVPKRNPTNLLTHIFQHTSPKVESEGGRSTMLGIVIDTLCVYVSLAL